MHDNNQYLKELLSSLLSYCQSQPPFTDEIKTEIDESFLLALEGICSSDPLDEQAYEQGQQLIERIIANYPHITPVLNRDILWLLGGNCMHFLVDDEIKQYQLIDEHMHEADRNGESLSFKQAKTSILKLH